jgi:hypothetical protein
MMLLRQLGGLLLSAPLHVADLSLSRRPLLLPIPQVLLDRCATQKPRRPTPRLEEHVEKTKAFSTLKYRGESID